MPARLSNKSRPEKRGIVQIAEALGVSPSTVSRALRPDTAHLVNVKRRKAILALAERQQFSPNLGARMLRQGVNTTLTVLVPLDENIFFSEYYGRFLSGTLHAAAARGWGVHISTLRRAPGSDFREALQYLSINTAGIIYLAEPLTNSDLARLKGYRRPFVLTKSAMPPDFAARDLAVPVVGVDNFGGAATAADSLLALGHRRVGLILGPATSRDARERHLGYLSALQRGEASPRPQWIFEGPFNADTGRAGATQFLTAADRPTAICCSSDEIAFGAINAARSIGLRCPEDISIIGFDDGLWATAARPALTTMRQPLGDLAERAVDLLVAAATSTDRPKRQALQTDLPAALVIRESTRSLLAINPAR